MLDRAVEQSDCIIGNINKTIGRANANMPTNNLTPLLLGLCGPGENVRFID